MRVINIEIANQHFLQKEELGQGRIYRAEVFPEQIVLGKAYENKHQQRYQYFLMLYKPSLCKLSGYQNVLYKRASVTYKKSLISTYDIYIIFLKLCFFYDLQLHFCIQCNYYDYLLLLLSLCFCYLFNLLIFVLCVICVIVNILTGTLQFCTLFNNMYQK